MWLRFGVTVLFILAIAAAVWDIVPWFEIQRWAVGEQRTFQNVMAGALRGIQAGNLQAVWTLCSATAAYGFFHALGPRAWESPDWRSVPCQWRNPKTVEHPDFFIQFSTGRDSNLFGRWSLLYSANRVC